MNDFFSNLDQVARETSAKYEINDLISIYNYCDQNNYWNRLAALSFFNKLHDEHRYHFLYEIQVLSCQLHFGIINCILFRDKISTTVHKPNKYNHRYTFMIESTIHCVYSFWSRVALVINSYLKKPKKKSQIYFSTVVPQLLIDYPALTQDNDYQWITNVKNEVELLKRNEFAHNNSLTMQNFISIRSSEGTFDDLLKMPDLLLAHNKSIVDEIYNLVHLLETLERLI